MTHLVSGHISFLNLTPIEKDTVFFVLSKASGFHNVLYADKFFKARLIRHCKRSEPILVEYEYDSFTYKCHVKKITLVESWKQAKRRVLKENSNV